MISAISRSASRARGSPAATCSRRVRRARTRENSAATKNAFDEDQRDHASQQESRHPAAPARHELRRRPRDLTSPPARDRAAPSVDRDGAAPRGPANWVGDPTRRSSSMRQVVSTGSPLTACRIASRLSATSGTPNRQRLGPTPSAGGRCRSRRGSCGPRHPARACLPAATLEIGARSGPGVG